MQRCLATNRVCGQTCQGDAHASTAILRPAAGPYCRDSDAGVRTGPATTAPADPTDIDELRARFVKGRRVDEAEPRSGLGLS